MSQRVVWCVLALVAAANAFAATTQPCSNLSVGTATFNLPGASTSIITKSGVTMTQSETQMAAAFAAPVSQTDPYPSGISIYFAKAGDCGAQFPSSGGVFIGTTITDAKGNFFHIVPGRYCAVTNGTNKDNPLAPRNIITVAFPGNGCAEYSGFADVNTLQLVWDKNNNPIVNKFNATFTVQCTFFMTPDHTPITGSIDFAAQPINSGGSKPTGTKTTAGSAPACNPSDPGGSGDSGGGTGGGGTGGPVGNVSFVFPDSVQGGPVAFTPGQSTTIPVSTAVANGFNGGIAISAITDARDTEFLDVTVTPNTIAAPGAGDVKVTVTTHPLTFPRDYNVTLLATSLTDGTQYASTFTISVLCDPPKILGTQQPKDATIKGNAPAILNVKSAGSQPFSYQWYTGMKGMTGFPVKDATGATLTTTQDGMYWVRVSNACGSADSEAASVSH